MTRDQKIAANAQLLWLEEADSGLRFDLTDEERAEAAQHLADERFKQELKRVKRDLQDHRHRLNALAN